MILSEGGEKRQKENDRKKKKGVGRGKKREREGERKREGIKDDHLLCNSSLYFWTFPKIINLAV